MPGTRTSPDAVLKRPLEGFRRRLQYYIRARGRNYIVAWAHRISGILLVLYLWLHLYTLGSLLDPAEYEAKMRFWSAFPFVFLEWLLAVPVIFHALNGARLVAYESFGLRKDPLVLRWVWGASGAYLVLLAVMMILDNQSVTPVFFWAVATSAGLGLVILAVSKIRPTGLSIFWKLHRLTGVFLLIMIPAHMFFMHLAQPLGHDSVVVIERMRIGFIKLIDLLLLLAALYHGGFGLVSMVKDYLHNRARQYGVAVVVVLVMTIAGWWGLRLILKV